MSGLSRQGGGSVLESLARGYRLRVLTGDGDGWGALPAGDRARWVRALFVALDVAAGESRALVVQGGCAVRPAPASEAAAVEPVAVPVPVVEPVVVVDLRDPQPQPEAAPVPVVVPAPVPPVESCECGWSGRSVAVHRRRAAAHRVPVVVAS